MSSATLTAPATGNTIAAEEYLATSYRPDREPLDGQLTERNLGEYDHSNLQTGVATQPAAHGTNAFSPSKEPPSCRAVTAYRTSASSPAISLWNRYSPARRWSASKFCPKTIRFGACRPVWTTI